LLVHRHVAWRDRGGDEHDRQPLGDGLGATEQLETLPIGQLDAYERQRRPRLQALPEAFGAVGRFDLDTVGPEGATDEVDEGRVAVDHERPALAHSRLITLQLSWAPVGGRLESSLYPAEKASGRKERHTE